MADAIRIIKGDHREVEGLFRDYEKLGKRAHSAKQSLALEICDKLTAHAQMEEQCFYPRLSQKFKKEDEGLVEEAYAEHEVAKDLISKIQTLSPEDPQFDAKVMVLREMVKHHVKEEEKEIIPESKKKLSPRMLEEMGEEMDAFKNR